MQPHRLGDRAHLPVLGVEQPPDLRALLGRDHPIPRQSGSPADAIPRPADSTQPTRPGCGMPAHEAPASTAADTAQILLLLLFSRIALLLRPCTPGRGGEHALASPRGGTFIRHAGALPPVASPVEPILSLTIAVIQASFLAALVALARLAAPLPVAVLATSPPAVRLPVVAPPADHERSPATTACTLAKFLHVRARSARPGWTDSPRRETVRLKVGFALARTSEGVRSCCLRALFCHSETGLPPTTTTLRGCASPRRPVQNPAFSRRSATSKASATNTRGDRPVALVSTVRARAAGAGAPGGAARQHDGGGGPGQEPRPIHVVALARKQRQEAPRPPHRLWQAGGTRARKRSSSPGIHKIGRALQTAKPVTTKRNHRGRERTENRWG